MGEVNQEYKLGRKSGRTKVYSGDTGEVVVGYCAGALAETLEVAVGKLL